MSRLVGFQKSLQQKRKLRERNPMTPIITPNGQPTISQETANRMQAQQMYMGVYFSLIPVVAADELRKVDGELGVELNIDSITATAKRIAVATMKTVGITVAD